VSISKSSLIQTILIPEKMVTDISQPTIKTVSQVTKEIKSHLDAHYQFVRISGEISNLRIPHSGHHYFNLRDENAQIRAVLFKNQSRHLEKPLSDGQQIICDGRITVYEPRGDYQIIIDTIDFFGLGHLQHAFEQLKKKLLQEGFFNRQYKQNLPTHIHRIVLITSPTGAAVHDFLSVCFRRRANVHIQILPVRVQGDGSAEDVIAALKTAETLNPDIIVLCRGGGSIEDLWTFNEEIVARAIFKNSIPIVSAVGHEIDVTIADFTSDIRCATPTAAAELLTTDRQELQRSVDRLMHRVARTMQWRFDTVQFRVEKATRFLSTFDAAFHTQKQQLETLRTRLSRIISLLIDRKETTLTTNIRRLEQFSPVYNLDLYHIKVDHLIEKLRQGVENQLRKKQSQLQGTAAVLDSVSPLATLSRGYSIVSDPLTQQIVTDANQVDPDEAVDVRLHRGILNCRVIKRR